MVTQSEKRFVDCIHTAVQSSALFLYLLRDCNYCTAATAPPGPQSIIEPSTHAHLSETIWSLRTLTNPHSPPAGQRFGFPGRFGYTRAHLFFRPVAVCGLKSECTFWCSVLKDRKLAPKKRRRGLQEFVAHDQLIYAPHDSSSHMIKMVN